MRTRIKTLVACAQQLMAANRICPAMPKKENPAGFSFRHDRRNAILNTYGSRIHRWISSRFQRCRGNPQTLFSSYSVDDTLLTATAGSIFSQPTDAFEKSFSRSECRPIPVLTIICAERPGSSRLYPESTVGCLKQETRAAVTILARSTAGALQSRRCDTCNTTPPRLWGRRAVFGHGDLDRLVTLGVSAPDGSAPAACAQRYSTG